MADKKPDGAKSDNDAAKPGAGKDESARGGSGGGIVAWLPLIVTIVLMPVLAVATTKFLILPKVVQARETAADAAEHEDSKAESKHGEAKEPKESKEPREGKDS